MITTYNWQGPHKREATQAHLVTNATWLDQKLILQGDKNNDHSYLSTRKYLNLLEPQVMPMHESLTTSSLLTK